MESPLTAREFLKRFHLPQLVRLSGGPIEDDGKHFDEQSAASSSNGDSCQQAGKLATRSTASAPSSSVTLGNEQRGRRPKQELDSHWTYNPAATATHEFKLETSNQVDQHSEFRSLFYIPNNREQDKQESRFHSISAWSSAQVDQLLEKQQQQDENAANVDSTASGNTFTRALVRVPRATLTTSSNTQRSADECCPAKGQVTGSGGQAAPPVGEADNEFSEHQQQKQRQQAKRDAFESIRLTPPSGQPALSKLSLNQPFLLYKAYKKLEICAYVLDPKNELNEKSGDPIYFPQNYPGWFAISSEQQPNPGQQQQTRLLQQRQLWHNSSSSNNNGNYHQHQRQMLLQPLHSIQQVSQSGWQIFLTRDEFVAYHLPKALSNQTKLKNDQLLALPLPVTFEISGSTNDKLSQGNGSRAQQRKQKNKSKSKNINDLGQIVIKSGQVLEICGLYDNLMTRIEGGKQQQIQEITKFSQGFAGHGGCSSLQPTAGGGSGTELCLTSQVDLNLPAQLQLQQQGHHHHQHYHQMAPQSICQHQHHRQQNQIYELNSYINGYHHPKRNLAGVDASVAMSQALAAQQQKEKILIKHEKLELLSFEQQRQQQRIVTAAKHHDLSCGRHCQLIAPPLIYAPPQQLETIQSGAIGGGGLSSLVYHHQPASIIATAIPIAAVPVSMPPIKTTQIKSATGKQSLKQQSLLGQQQQLQMYARCRLLNEHSLDRLTDFSGRISRPCEQQIGEPEQIEVLVPIEQLGRFYLCATNQLVNEMLYASSNPNSASINISNMSNFVFRLNQIVSILNVSKRLATANSRCYSLQQPQQQQLRVPRLLFLPLIAQLVIGPRPANFSPSMFGPSSTLESYFRSESNIGGHSIECKYNKNFKAKTSTAKTDSDPANASQRNDSRQLTCIIRGPACACALPKPINTTASTSINNNTSTTASSDQMISESYEGMFSALLRIERVHKRDVLLACTIKKDPLVHLDLFSDCDLSTVAMATTTINYNQKQAKHSGASNQQQHNKLAGFTISHEHPNSKLFKLSEQAHQENSINKKQHLIGLQQQQAHDDQQQQLQAKTVSKLSSLSRLRACRSLINLNVRKRKRPKIPSCMLSEVDGGERPPGSSSLLLNRATLGDADIELLPYAVSNVYLSDKTKDQQQQQTTTASSIVTVEFDCSNKEILFVRTFVESSIPTSTIPDLVLNRMELCHKHSNDWERQLKLSYQTLSQDFESCRRQLAQNRAVKQLAAVVAAAERRKLSFGSANLVLDAQNNQQQQLHDHVIATDLLVASESFAGGSVRVDGHQSLPNVAQKKTTKTITTAANARQLVGPTASLASNSINSSASSSSCSSSGVSSSAAAATSSEQSNKQYQTTDSNSIRANARKVTGTNTSTKSSASASISESLSRGSASSSECASSSITISGSIKSYGLRRLLGKILSTKFVQTQNSSSRSSLGVASAGDIGSKSGKQIVNEEQQRRIINELNACFKRETRVTCGSLGKLFFDQSSDQEQSTEGQYDRQLDHGTLMDAKKIHRKLMSSSERHLLTMVTPQPVGLKEDDCESSEVSNDDESQQSGDLDSYSDTGSHLYEKLEKITEDIRKQRPNITAQYSQQQHQKLQQNKFRRIMQRASRSAVEAGGSIEFAEDGDRRTALASRCRSQEPLTNGNTDSSSEQEDDDEWWLRSTSRVAQTEPGTTTSVIAPQTTKHQPQQQQQRQFFLGSPLAKANDTKVCGHSGNIREQQQRQLSAGISRSYDKQNSHAHHCRQAGHTSGLAATERGRQRTSFDNCALEPMSIEACTEELVLLAAAAADGKRQKQRSQQQHELQSRAGSIVIPDQQQQRRRSLIDKKGNSRVANNGDDGQRERHDCDSIIYMNLAADCEQDGERNKSQQQSRSLLELSVAEVAALCWQRDDEQANRRGKLLQGEAKRCTVGRMERKLMKIRNRHRQQFTVVSSSQQDLATLHNSHTGGQSFKFFSHQHDGCLDKHQSSNGNASYDNNSPEEDDEACEKLELRSINLPAVESHRRRRLGLRNGAFKTGQWEPIKRTKDWKQKSENLTGVAGKGEGESTNAKHSLSLTPASCSSLVSIEMQTTNASTESSRRQAPALDGAAGERKEHSQQQSKQKVKQSLNTSASSYHADDDDDDDDDYHLELIDLDIEDVNGDINKSYDSPSSSSAEVSSTPSSSVGALNSPNSQASSDSTTPNTKVGKQRSKVADSPLPSSPSSSSSFGQFNGSAGAAPTALWSPMSSAFEYSARQEEEDDCENNSNNDEWRGELKSCGLSSSSGCANNNKQIPYKVRRPVGQVTSDQQQQTLLLSSVGPPSSADWARQSRGRCNRQHLQQQQ